MLDLRMLDGTPVTPEARQLTDAISDISEHLREASWLLNIEWDVWCELERWRTTGQYDWSEDAVVPNPPGLDQLTKAAGGWVWRRFGFGIEFVPDAVWQKLVRVRAAAGVDADNERIAKLAGLKERERKL